MIMGIHGTWSFRSIISQRHSHLLLYKNLQGKPCILKFPMLVLGRPSPLILLRLLCKFFSHKGIFRALTNIFEGVFPQSSSWLKAVISFSQKRSIVDAWLTFRYAFVQLPFLIKSPLSSIKIGCINIHQKNWLF